MKQETQLYLLHKEERGASSLPVTAKKKKHDTYK